MRPSGIRLTRLAVAALALLSAAGLPIPAHADHTAQVSHVEQAHGGHDTVVIQTTERQKPDATVLATPVARIVLTDPPETPVRGTEAEPQAPDARPPISQTLPRAPPTLL